MSRTSSSRPWATWPRAATLVIGAGALTAVAWCAVLLFRYPQLGISDTVVTILLGLPAVVLGLLVALRRPRNAVAPLLTLVGSAVIVVVALGDEQTAVTVGLHEMASVTGFATALAQGSWMLLYLPTALLLLVFPTGRFAGRAWRRVGIALLVVSAVFLVLAGGPEEGFDEPFQDVPPPYHLPLPFHVVSAALPVVFLGLLVASAASMIVRYRRAVDPVVRAQLRWFALGSMLLPVSLLLCWLSYLLLGHADLVMIGIGLTAVAVPVATVIALLRHDLYDVDRAFSAAVTYSLVSGVLLAIFAAASAAGGAVLGEGSAIAAAVATALCAVALAPLRRRLSEQVDRRLYPLRQAVRTSLARLRTRIDAGLARPEDLGPTLRAALRDPGLRIGYVLPGRPGLVDERCQPIAVTGREVPVQLGGTHVGSLLPDTTPAPRELLRETAAASGLLVELIRSRLEITEALREVADSRARLLQAGYRERRRLERDLHDGAQQRLVSLGMAIRLAQRRLGTTPLEDMDGLLDQAVAELGTAVAELRAIAQGLRPADLDAGLGPAIRSLTTGVPIPVRLHVCEERVPDEVATTAYYVASEALANVVKHSGAGNVDVSVARRDDAVVVRIVDDGRGGATARPGSGLAGLVDRVAAAGGRFTVSPGTPAGTAVEAVLPCAP
jgi:signal transduction histidine kinase